MAKKRWYSLSDMGLPGMGGCVGATEDTSKVSSPAGGGRMRLALPYGDKRWGETKELLDGGHAPVCWC